MTQKSEVHIARWLNEDREEDFIDAPEASDDGVDQIEEQVESSGTEYSSGVEDNTDVDDLDWETVFDVIEGPSSEYYLGLEGTKWMKEPLEARTSTKSEYIPNIQAGPRDFAKTKKKPSECFSLFFDESIIYMIAKYTNERILREKKKFSRERDAKLTDEVEIYALLGILFLGGSSKSSKEHFLQLFDSKKGIGMEAIYLAMSSQRYRFLMKNLRFNDPVTDQITEDKMAPIRVLFQILVNNFQTHFKPSHELAFGELLTVYKGRCGFRQHTPKKNVKYGIKMFALVDCQYPYTYNLELYLGNNPGPYEISNRKLDVVMRMTDPIQGEYRNVTMKNSFTTLELAEALFAKKVTIIGSIKPDKKEVPRAFRTIKDKALYSSMFGFSDVATLVQYICKRDKAVLLMSTKHCECSIDKKSDQLKPEIKVDYDRTKTALEILDKMCSKNDVSRNSRWWPATILFRLMNIAAVNALCIYTFNRGLNEKIVRHEFQIELGLSMIKPMLQRRVNSERIPKTVKQKICELLDIPIPLDVELNVNLTDLSSTCIKTGPRGKCYICKKKRVHKSSRDLCINCESFICLEHRNLLCMVCYDTLTN